MFEVIGNITEAEFKTLPVSSLTIAANSLIELTAGSTTWQACTSTSNFFTRKAITMEAGTAASSILAYELDGTEKVRCTATNNGNTSHNGDRMTLTDETAVNNTGSDVTGQAVSFVQDGISGATTDKRLIGRILVGNGVDPDAA